MAKKSNSKEKKSSAKKPEARKTKSRKTARASKPKSASGKSSGPKSTKKTGKKINSKEFPTIKINKDTDIAMDFATKAYERFNKLIKSVVLFGSTAKQTKVAGSDIDIIIILDDISVAWDEELIAWYREELDKIMRKNPYKSDLHINTVRLSTWWDDLLRGDPVVINILRYGETMIDFGGFFEPLKFLLLKGKIKSTPEAVYSCLERAPQHFVRSKMAELGTIEGLYWAMVDSAHAALIARNVLPPSPEHVSLNLKETFVNSGELKMKYVTWYRDILFLHKKIAHGDVTTLKGVEVDMWQDRTDEFMRTMALLVDKTIGPVAGSPNYMKNTNINLGLDDNTPPAKPQMQNSKPPSQNSQDMSFKQSRMPLPKLGKKMPASKNNFFTSNKNQMPMPLPDKSQNSQDSQNQIPTPPEKNENPVDNSNNLNNN